MKCKVHGVDLIVIEPYCPVCRGSHGGINAAKLRSKVERKTIARKAARARWGKNPRKRGNK